MTKLSTVALSKLSPKIRIPQYDRTNLRQHIVHLGVGGFHRAHQAVYLDDLLALPDTERWAECGVGVLPADARMRDALASQDHLYTLVERSADTATARVIGSMTGFILAPEAREAALEKLAAADTRIVSLTITEGGYFIDEATGAFLENHPDIQRDLLNPIAPITSIGLIAEALDRRRLRNLPPFTVMSCDNLQHNGHVIRKVLLGFTALSNPTLRQWIAHHVAFPNCMVDRITPATTPADIAFVSENFGIDDAWPVVTEPFLQWVVEDTFSAGRPAWERVGVQFTPDVAPYEIMKMRLLNGSHLAMAYLGALHGYTRVHEIMQDPVFARFITAFMDQVTPVVPVIPDTSIPNYKRTLIERFANPTINDQVTRICSEGSAKIPKWLLPSITELLDAGAPMDLLALVVASWIFYFTRFTDERGQPLDIIDARAPELTRLASQSVTDPSPFLALESIFGAALPANLHFVQTVTDALDQLSTTGVIATLQHYLTIS